MAVMTAEAQPAANRTVDINYVYAADLGFGGYRLTGLSASVYTLPLSYRLEDTPSPGWALDVLFPVQAGVYSFRATDADGSRIGIDQQSISVVPGLELHIPLGQRTVLKPFVQVGEAHAFGSGTGNPDSWIYLAGVHSLTEWHAGDTTLSLGTGVVFAGDQSIGPGFVERYAAVQIGGEVRHPLGFAIGASQPDLGVYVADYYYPDPLKFTRFLKRPLRVPDQGEIGFSIGSATPLKLLWLSRPRVGFGYVFGGGLQVWHVNFGFRF